MPATGTLAFDVPLWLPSTPAEERLLGALSSLADSASGSDPGREVRIDAGGEIPASRLRSVCTSTFIADVLRGRRLLVVGASVTGPLDLSFVDLAYPLAFERCSFDGDIKLHHARLAHLCFADCTLRSLDASGAVIRGDLDLCGEGGGPVRTRVRMGMLSLRGAHISGSLRLCDARIRNPRGFAVQANDLRVGGKVEMERTLTAGEVTLYNARIRGDLLCTRARLFNPRRVALAAELIHVEGSVLMHDVRSWGEIKMMNARCRGNLDFDGARLRNEAGDVLSLDHLRVGGSVFLRSMVAHGTVRIPGSDIGLDLDCWSAELRGPGHDARGQAAGGTTEETPALMATRLRARGNVYLTGLRATGPVLMTGSRLGGFVRCRDASLMLRHPAPSDDGRAGCCLCAAGAIIQGSVEISGTTANAPFDFRGVRIAGSLAVRQVTLDEEGVTGLVLEHASVAGEFCWIGTQAKARTGLNLAHARLGRIRHGRRSWPSAPRLRLQGCLYQTVDFSEEDADRGDERPGKRAPVGLLELFWGSTRREPDALKWLYLQGTQRFDPQTYEQLYNVRRRSGDDDEAKQIAMGMERVRSRQPGMDAAARLVSHLKGGLLHYGHSTRRVWTLSILAILLGAGLFDQARRGDVMTLVHEDVYLDLAYQRDGEPEHYPRFNALVYSLDAFLPVIDLHQESYWLPNAKRGCRLVATDTMYSHCGGYFRGYLWLHIIVGWVATTLLLISITGVVRNTPSD